jgi:predicted nucleic acid-binding protein
MLRYLLDTNIVIYVLKRRPVEVLATFNANASRMAISSITLAELLHGAEKSSRVSENLAAIEDFCSRLNLCPTALRPRSTTAPFALPWRNADSLSVSMTCTLRPTPAAKGWFW